MNNESKTQFSEYQMFVLEKAEIDCIDIVKLMGDFHDHELSESLQGRLEEHVACCSQCQRFADSYGAVVKLANELGREEKPIPQPVKSRLREALNQRLGINLSRQSGI